MTAITDVSSPFHAGERAAHSHAGVSPPRAPGIRPFMPDQHRDFFATLPAVMVAARDRDGWPVPTILSGRPGFISSPDPGRLCVAPMADAGDPVRPLLTAGSQVGLLGIEPASRRRNRANGRVASIDGGTMTVAVEQSFGNCPQYIHPRYPAWHDAPRQAPPERFTGLDAPARAQIARADTFFVASGAESGLDISHRGGPAGFVTVDGDALVVPDYRGNRYFNTLGNLLLDPRASLLFVDFERGDMLVVRGRAAIDWTGDALPTGAERRWRLQVEDGWRRPGALPLRWTRRAA